MEVICPYPQSTGMSGETYFINDRHLKKIRVKYHPSSKKVCVSGSLHKYLKGNNYTCFRGSEIKIAVHTLADYLKVDLNEPTLKITKIEIAVNVETDKPPLKYCNCLVAYKKTLFENCSPARRKIDKWGKIAKLTDFSIKFYDKYIQTNLTTHSTYKDTIADCKNNLLRYEISYFRTDKFPYLSKLESLYQPNFLRKAETRLTECFRHFKKQCRYDTIANPQEAYLIYAFTSSLFIEDYLEKLPVKERKALKRKHKNLLKKHAPKEDIIITLEKLIQEQIKYLISS